jgi:hypothetical protein
MTKLRGTLEGDALGARGELKAIAPWAIIGRLLHRCATAGDRSRWDAPDLA